MQAVLAPPVGDLRSPPVADSVALAEQTDLVAIRHLLVESGLPLDGLMDAPTTLLAAHRDGRLVGGGALEEHGGFGLIRSVVVEAGERSGGVGSLLMDHLEAVARRRRLAAVYLLTETAEPFFAGRGYVPIARYGAPGPVTDSVAWSVACGESAVAMMLGGSPPGAEADRIDQT